MKTCPRCSGEVPMLGACSGCSSKPAKGDPRDLVGRATLAPVDGLASVRLPDAITGRGTAFDGNLLPSVSRAR